VRCAAQPARTGRLLASLALALAASACGPFVTMRTPGTPPEPREVPPPVFVTVRIEAPGSAPSLAPPAESPRLPPGPRPVPVLPHPGLPTATRIGLLTPAQCFAELDRLGVPYRRQPSASGIRTPIRLTGPVAGVRYRGLGRRPDATPYSLLDCRMAVALVELSAILRGLGVVEGRYYSIHRPHHRGKPVGSGGRIGHRGGMAIDLASLTLADGATLTVLNEFRGRRGRPVCGPDADPGSTPAARLLRQVVCRAEERRLFNVLLTPNHDYPHRNHFHMEVRPDGVKWFVLH